MLVTAAVLFVCSAMANAWFRAERISFFGVRKARKTLRMAPVVMLLSHGLQINFFKTWFALIYYLKSWSSDGA